MSAERFSSREHWLKFDECAPRQCVVGCQCGFRADPDDNGYGDSVVDHIAEVAAAEALAKLADWAEARKPILPTSPSHHCYNQGVWRGLHEVAWMARGHPPDDFAVMDSADSAPLDAL